MSPQIYILILRLVGQWSCLGIDSCAKLLVEHIETIAVVLDHAKVVDDVLGVLLFLHLLIYKPLFNTDVSIYKSFLKDCLTFQLYVNDVFGTNDSHIIGKYGKLKETIFDEFSTSKISLTVRYKFNVTRSKYKGTGAGQSQKDRM